MRDAGPQSRPGLIGEVGIAEGVGMFDEVGTDDVLNLPPLVFRSGREVAVLRKIRSCKPHGKAAERGDRGNNPDPLLEALLAFERVPEPAEGLIDDAIAGLIVDLSAAPHLLSGTAASHRVRTPKWSDQALSAASERS